MLSQDYEPVTALAFGVQLRRKPWLTLSWPSPAVFSLAVSSNLEL